MSNLKTATQESVENALKSKKAASLKQAANDFAKVSMDDPDMAPGEAALDYLLTHAKRARSHVEAPKVALKDLNWVMDAMGAYLGAVGRFTGVDLSTHAALAGKLSNLLVSASHRVPQHIEVPAMPIDDDQLWEPGD